jgi:hypothetical protein
MNSIFDGDSALSSSSVFDTEILKQIEAEAFRSLIIATGAMLLAWYVLASFGVGLGDVVEVL